MRVLLRLALLGLVIATAGSSRALADPTTSALDPATVKLAKQYVDAAIAAQDAHDDDTAIALYSRAYQLTRHPALIFNLAQVHRLAGHADKALVLYRRYLAEDPEGAQATIARSFVADLGERAAAKAAARPPGAARAEGDQADGAGEPVVERATLGAALVDAPPVPPSNHRAWKWALGISGGLAVGSGLFTVYAFRRQTEAVKGLAGNVSSADCGRSAASLGLSPASEQSFAQACAWHTREAVGFWLTSAALVATVVSLVMVSRDPGTPEPGAASHDKHEVAIAPILAPGTGGASLSVTW